MQDALWDSVSECMVFNTARFVNIANVSLSYSTSLPSSTHIYSIECTYTLMTFGIPAEVLPVEPMGDLRIQRHVDWLNMRRQHEASMKNNNSSTEANQGARVVVPGPYDVLLGRGKPLQKHPGNLRYHRLVDSYKEEYDQAQKIQKTNIALSIVQKIKDYQGRFLKQDDTGQWRTVDDDTARYKVAHTFRNHRIAARAQQQKREEEAKKHSRPPNEDMMSASDTDASMPSVPGKRSRVNNDDDFSADMFSEDIIRDWVAQV